jgi:hypothetical protein
VEQWCRKAEGAALTRVIPFARRFDFCAGGARRWESEALIIGTDAGLYRNARLTQCPGECSREEGEEGGGEGGMLFSHSMP